MTAFPGGSPGGLHLGWIPNDPGLRTREFPGRAPAEPGPDPARLQAVENARQWSGMRRVLAFAGTLALVMLGAVAVAVHSAVFWSLAAGLAAACWLGLALSALSHRRAVAALRTDDAERARRHAAAIAGHEEQRAAWARSEADRVAAAPRWLRVSSPGGVRRLDVFGGTADGRRSMLAGLGGPLLREHAVIALDLSAGRVTDGLIAAASRAGLPYAHYRLPRDLREVPLLDGLSGEQVASQITEVLHAGDPNATTAGRATDLMVLRKVISALGGDAHQITMARIHEALSFLLTGAGSPGAGRLLRDTEPGRLRGEFGTDFRREVTPNLVRLAAITEPLRELGADLTPRRAARLTCLSLDDGPRDVAADLTAALIVQWVTQAISKAGAEEASGPGWRGRTDPLGMAIVLAGADEQAARHLSRLTAVCERYGVPLVRTFSRLTEESARHLDSRNTAFMRLATRPEAQRAAEHMGLERKFVAGRFSYSRGVSRSRTRSRGESVTHTAGTAQSESVTRTTGTTTGESLSETEVRRHNDAAARAGNGGTRQERAGEASAGRAARERRADSGGSDRGGKPQPFVKDFIKTRAQHTFASSSEAKTQGWTQTEETSHTRSRTWSTTDGMHADDEVTYTLTYDHKIAPETLMELPEDQMLAPHVVEGAVEGAAAGPGRPLAQSRMVALIVDPAVIGTDPVAAVMPGEIPAYQPPALLVSPPVPDDARSPRSG